MYKSLPYSLRTNQIIFFGLLISLSMGGCANASPAATASTSQQFTLTMASTPEIPNYTPSPGIATQASTIHVSPYVKVTVENVAIRYLETKPVQIELVISGTLPDQCEYEFYSIENRNNQDILVSLAGIHPADTNCSQEIQAIEYVLPLGQDMPEVDRGFAKGDYQLTVNNYQTGFSIK